ncbi:PrsW family intramembrane metalloprotease [bacterium]|nr:PrsW family intramembrane metalloprotease [bacterium]
MIIFVIIAIALAPGIFWAWFFYKRDKLEPEPVKKIVKLFFYGMLIAFPAAIIEQLITGSESVVLYIITAPVVEEFLKFIIVFITIFRDTEFDEPLDGIIYASAIALGFASLENIGYLYAAHRSGTLVNIGILRAILSVPGHALFSSMWGLALGLAKFSRYSSRNIILGGLLLSMVFHSVFNFFTLGIPQISFGIFIFSFLMWVILYRSIARLLKISPYYQEQSEKAGKEFNDDIEDG